MDSIHLCFFTIDFWCVDMTNNGYKSSGIFFFYLIAEGKYGGFVCVEQSEGVVCRCNDITVQLDVS